MDSVLLLVLDNSCNRRGLEDKRRDWGIRENMLDLFINVFFFFFPLLYTRCYSRWVEVVSVWISQIPVGSCDVNVVFCLYQSIPTESFLDSVQYIVL